MKLVMFGLILFSYQVIASPCAHFPEELRLKNATAEKSTEFGIVKAVLEVSDLALVDCTESVDSQEEATRYEFDFGSTRNVGVLSFYVNGIKTNEEPTRLIGSTTIYSDGRVESYLGFDPADWEYGPGVYVYFSSPAEGSSQWNLQFSDGYRTWRTLGYELY
jgi:hypothetical protein